MFGELAVSDGFSRLSDLSDFKALCWVTQLYSKYLDLKHSFERLRGDYSRLQQRYASIDASFDRVQEENRGLKAVTKDYDTLCRGYGEKEIAARVRAIQDQETAARRQRRMERQHRYEIGAK